MRVCVGSPGTFSTRKWRSATLAICGRCVIVSDLCPPGEPLQRLAHRVRRAAADARVDLVEDERLAAAYRRDREGDPRELAARCGLRDRRERQARVRADQEGDAVLAGRARVGRVEHGLELALAEADALELTRNGLRERRCGLFPRLVEL